MNLKKAFCPQISPIGADEPGAYPVRPDHLPGESRALTTSLLYLRNLRNLRIALGF
jgi:hypothetical protein